MLGKELWIAISSLVIVSLDLEYTMVSSAYRSSCSNVPITLSRLSAVCSSSFSVFRVGEARVGSLVLFPIFVVSNLRFPVEFDFEGWIVAKLFYQVS